MRLVARSVNVETVAGGVQHVGGRQGGRRDAADHEARRPDQLGAQAAGARVRHEGGGASIRRKKVPFQATMLYSRALAAKDAGNKDEAVQLLQKSFDRVPRLRPGAAGSSKQQPAERRAAGHGMGSVAATAGVPASAGGACPRSHVSRSSSRRLDPLSPRPAARRRRREWSRAPRSGFPTPASLDPARATVIVLDRALLAGAGERGGGRPPPGWRRCSARATAADAEPPADWPRERLRRLHSRRPRPGLAAAQLRGALHTRARPRGGARRARESRSSARANSRELRAGGRGALHRARSAHAARR